MIQRMLTVAAMAVAVCSTAIAQEPPGPPPESAIDPAEISTPDGSVLDLPPGVEVMPGVVASRSKVTLGVNFDAQILEVHVEEGQHVRQGDVIARLDDRAARAAMALAQHEAGQMARVQRARFMVERAQRVLERTMVAQARGAATAEELADAATDLAVAQADFAEARELQTAAALRLAQARVQVERHLIRAPFDGAVIRVVAEPGAIVTSGDPIADLMDVDRLAVDLFLPAAAAHTVEPGRAYAVRLRAPTDMVVWARARYVEPRIEPTSGTVRTTFEFDLPRGAILAGILVTPADRAPSERELAFMAGGRDGAEAFAAQTDDP